MASSAKRTILASALGVTLTLLIYIPVLWVPILVHEFSFSVPSILILMGSSVVIGVITGYVTHSFIRGALAGMISGALGCTLADMLPRLVLWRILYQMGIAVAHIGFWWSLIPGFLGLYGGLIGGFIGEFLIARAKYFWTPTRLLLNGTLTPEIAAWLWMLMENSFPILICGEMDSGRTSLINALCFFVKPDSRVGTVEDDSEFKLPLRHKNWLRLSTRDSLNVGGQPISQDKILEQMLRQSVEYIVVNEVKGKGDLSTWINAVSLGHGGVTSFHASSFDDLTLRLQQLGIEKDSLLTISGGIIFVARFKERKSMVVRIRALIQVVNKNGDITGEPLVNYDAQNCSYAIDTNRLLSSMPAKKISESTGKDARELFENKVNYLKWLFGYAKTKRNVLEPDGFFSEISRYYEDPDYYKRFIKKP